MVEQYLVSSWVVFSWLLLALQVKVVKVASFVGKIFVLQCSTTNSSPLLYMTRYTVHTHTAIIWLVCLYSSIMTSSQDVNNVMVAIAS